MTMTDPAPAGDQPATVAACRCATSNHLSEREMQTLTGMSRGRSNGEIGRDLHLSEDTVKSHARRLFRKLGVTDRAHAVARAYQLGVLTVDGEPAAPVPPPVPAVRPDPPRAATVVIERSERGVQVLARAMFGDRGTDPHFQERSRVAIERLAGGVG